MDDFEKTDILVKVDSEWEAELIKGILTDRGIRVALGGTQAAGFRAEAPAQVNVVVPEHDVERAAEILREASMNDETDIECDVE